MAVPRPDRYRGVFGGGVNRGGADRSVNFMRLGTQMAVGDVEHVETGVVIFMDWNAGAGTRLDRPRAFAAALTGCVGWRRPMKFIVDEAGEIIAQTTDDHTLIGGHHRLAVAASLGKKLFWRDTGEPVKLDHFFKHHGSSLRHTA
jgi:hypothetical protein